MAKLKDRLKRLDNQIKKKWDKIDSQSDLNTREKLEKLVKQNLKREERDEAPPSAPVPAAIPEEPFIVREYTYPPEARYGRFQLQDWQTVKPESVAVLMGDDQLADVDPMDFLYFDTETTGLAGGTGTVPFMLGFGFFTQTHFLVKIFILNDLAAEGDFLAEVDRFFAANDFSGVVTYNGRAFDIPLMETRYILQRRRFPLLSKPHLDFLFPARMLWRHTFESRKLGFLGDRLLGISREDDVDGSQIPMLYFSYLRSQSFSLIEPVIEHNALDIVGLASLLLLGVKYVEDDSHTMDEGEVLGVASVYEKYGDFQRAAELYQSLNRPDVRDEIAVRAIKKLAILKKREKLFNEAGQLWQALSGFSEASGPQVYRELALHYEHREKDYARALEYAKQGMDQMNLTSNQRRDFEKRLNRIRRKMHQLDKEGMGLDAGKKAFAPPIPED